MNDLLTAEDLLWMHSLDLSISICSRMEELGLTKKELAEKAGMKPSGLSRIISGEQNMTLSTIAKLERALGIRFDSGFRYSGNAGTLKGDISFDSRQPINIADRLSPMEIRGSRMKETVIPMESISKQDARNDDCKLRLVA